MFNLTLRQLRTLVSVARHLSFVRAAEELHLTPPAVTMQVQELEKAVGHPVFERSGKATRLTPVGESMLAGARQVLTTLRDTEDSVARVRQLKTGRLTIGAVSTAKYFLPRLLARFRDEHPGVEIQLSVSNRAELIRLMAGRDVDLAVMGRPPRELETQSELFSPHPLGVIAAPAHPLAQRRRINPGELEDQPFLVRERGSGTRLSMEHFFREHRIAPRTSMEVDSNETIKQAVIANLGLALLSLHTVELELRARLLVVLDVVGTPLMRSWHLVSLRAAGLSPAADAFRQFVLDRGRRLLDEQFKDLPLVTPGDAQPARKSRRSRRKRAR